MATQVKYGLPNGDFAVIDNGASQVVITANGTPQSSSGQTGINFDKATLGLDNTLSGTLTQGINSFGDTGSAGLLDPVNDLNIPQPRISTFPGNPVLQTAPTFAKVSTILNSQFSTTLLWKNPA